MVTLNILHYFIFMKNMREFLIELNTLLISSDDSDQKAFNGSFDESDQSDGKSSDNE